MPSDNQFWYDIILDTCFPQTPKVPRSAFAKVFLGFITAPANREYKNPQHTRDSATIHNDQLALLSRYADAIGKWCPCEIPTKNRMQELADFLLVQADLGSEKNYLDKHNRYQAKHFTGFYVPDPQSQTLYDRVVALYGNFFAKIYLNQPDQLRQALSETVEHLPPELANASPVGGTDAEQLGQYLCDLLLWHSTKDAQDPRVKDLRFQLLNIIDDSESLGTQSGPLSQDTSVPASTAQLVTVCSAALKSELNFEELESIFRILQTIQENVDGPIPEEFQKLVGQFMHKATTFTQAFLDPNNRRFDDPMSYQSQQALIMATTCFNWLK